PPPGLSAPSYGAGAGREAAGSSRTSRPPVHSRTPGPPARRRTCGLPACRRTCGQRRTVTMPETGYSGRNVVVFGAAGALGGGLAAAFAAAGAAVTGADRKLPAADRRLDGIRYHQVDVLDDAALGDLFRQEPVPWAVVNTVGGYAPHTKLEALDPGELTAQLTLNLVSAALVTKHALAALRHAGQGRIVHTASRAAQVTRGQGFAYSVSKLGVLRLVTMAADEARGTGITVNCVV